MQIRTDCDGSFFISGVHEAIESLGRVCPHGEQPYVIDDDEVGAEDSGDDASDAVIRAVGAHQRTEVFEAKPRHAHPGFDDLLAEGLKEERFPRAGWPANDHVLLPVYPFQRAQRLLCGQGNRQRGGIPGVKRFPRREPGGFAPGGEQRPGPAGDFLNEEGLETSAGSQRWVRAVISSFGARARA